VFSVTLSVSVRFRERCPRVLRGMLPYGVRTFLQQALRLTSDHLPSADNLAQKPKSGSQETRSNHVYETKIPGFLVSRLPDAWLRMAMEL
jgi:hypothetical protein